ncbi:MAG: class I SAM-dependent methyltransferase, partial [Hyphomicrobiales bacterium]|nr:class I SAM-dependent methyltransferase [Hyphomicrobiales bacterium]
MCTPLDHQLDACWGGQHDSDLVRIPDIGCDMRTDPQSGIHLIGVRGPGSDDVPSDLAEVLASALDRSSSSDELASLVVDAETRVQLSRLRPNILRPLKIVGGLRVLEVWAGSGANARYLGELGVEVVALEPDLALARAAQARCAGLSNVQVVCGELEDYTDEAGFDVVLLCGMLIGPRDREPGGHEHGATEDRRPPPDTDAAEEEEGEAAGNEHLERLGEC